MPGTESSACLKIPKCIGRLAILKPIGRGAMGVVLKGWDPFIERYVAIKIPTPPREVLEEHQAGGYNRKFFKEAQAAGKLSHPNIVSIYDADMCGPFCYLAMEYVDGCTLERFCENGRLLPYEKAAAIVFNTCRALDYAHNQGIVHRDIKPANIMISRSGSVKITDFSIAKMTHDAMQTMVQGAQFGIRGTLRYMSPQHFNGNRQVDARSDIFSLGCVLYELLTGVPAFLGTGVFNTMFKITSEEAVPVTKHRPELPEIFDRIVAKALAKDPENRYQSCMDLAYELSVALRHARRDTFGDTVEIFSDYSTNVSFFKEFSKAQFAQVLNAGQLLKAKKGRVIVKEGEVDDTLYVILSGKASVLKGELEIDTIDRGECFGEMAYLAGQPRAASVKAATDCILLKIRASLMDRVPKKIQILFLKSFARTAVDRISKNHKFIQELVAAKKTS